MERWHTGTGIKNLCPKCGSFVAYEEHIFRDKIELRCPVCGFKVKTIYREVLPSENET